MTWTKYENPHLPFAGVCKAAGTPGSTGTISQGDTVEQACWATHLLVSSEWGHLTYLASAFYSGSL